MAGSSSPPLSDSLESCDSPEDDPSRTRNSGAEGGKQRKKFHPFRAVRNIFRRAKRQGSEDDPQLHSSTSKKSRSTSELSSSTSAQGSSPTGDGHLGYPVSSGMLLHPNNNTAGNHGLHAGLSVSHDSIFASEHTASVSSGASLKDAAGGSGQQGSALSVHNMAGHKGFREELMNRFRNRRDSDDEDDPGLPRSPCTSPTTADVLAQGLKDKSSKSHSTCSAGSLISMCSSENDEDLAAMYSSSHSSSRRSADFDGELDVSQPVPLNHEAALHKMAVRPKRTHGLPRHRRMQQQMALAAVGQSLPATPEVTEDSSLPQVVAMTSQQDVAPMVDMLTSSSSLAEVSDSSMEPAPTSIYCVDTTTATIEVTDPPAEVIEAVTVDVQPDVTTEIVPEQNATTGPSSVQAETVENADALEVPLPVVKVNKGKSKSAELKLRHEIKQYSKRQQEKMRGTQDGPPLPPDAFEHREETSESISIEETLTVASILDQSLTGDADVYVEDDFANGNVDTKGENDSKVLTKLEKKENHSEAEVIPVDKQETKLEVQKEPVVTVISEMIVETVVAVSEVNTLMSTSESVKDVKPNVSEEHTPVPQLEVLDEVVLRHPEKAVDKPALIPNQESVSEKSSVESDSYRNSTGDAETKLVEHAFSSGDFAGIMKKRRSKTDSCGPGELPPPAQAKSVLDMVKQSTPIKRLSVEIATFDQRAKEQVTKLENKKDGESSSPEEVDLRKKQDSRQESLLHCPPVTIRIRRGKSLVERYSESSAEVKPEVKSVEKPLFRPRSQVVNQADSNNKLPEFMKIQLRSSREELNVGVKSDSVAPTNPQPQWEVKIQPQANQRRQSGPNSLPQLVAKSASPDHKQDIPKVALPKEVKIEPSTEKENQPEVKVESKEVEISAKPVDERVSVCKQDDSSKVKRNSSENKENVASSNVQREVERKVSTDESKQDAVIDKTLHPDVRRRSFVQPKDNDEHEPELLRVFARRSYKQKSSDKAKKEENGKEETKPASKPEQNAQPKVDVKPTKSEVSRIPVKPKVDMKSTFNEKPLVKQDDVPKQATKEPVKSFERNVTPVKIQVSELQSPKTPVGLPTSPKAPTPEVVTAKPDRRESLNLRSKPSSVPASQPAPQNPKIPSESSAVKPQVKETPSFVPGKLERRESSSFKVKPSEAPSNRPLQARGSDKGPSGDARSQLGVVKRGELVKMASMDSPGPVKEKDSGKDAPTWLQLAQQRREKREQKERLLYGQNSNSFLLEGANKPSRNSKVLDLVNNFQKMQTT